jgi:hypothetical protein
LKKPTIGRKSLDISKWLKYGYTSKLAVYTNENLKIYKKTLNKIKVTKNNNID